MRFTDFNIHGNIQWKIFQKLFEGDICIVYKIAPCVAFTSSGLKVERLLDSGFEGL